MMQFTLHQTLNALEGLLKQPKTSLGEIFDLGSEDKKSASSSIKFDLFVGLTALEAAKKYLKMRKDARPFQEIVDAIKSGGGPFHRRKN